VTNMPDKFSDLNDAFDVEAEIVRKEPEKKQIKKPSDKEDVTKDYEYTRGNLYSIIEKGQEALDCALELAQDGGQPRQYEVVGQLIKNVADATDKLIDLQKKLKELDADQKGPTNVTNNAMFFGSTAELSKMIKAQSKNLKEDK
jgi:methylmalonyl-CoA mutase N-terminal domain/subunit